MTVERMPACALFLAMCVSLAGCATPDLRPYSEQTANLVSAISAEQRSVSTKMAELAELSEPAQKKKYEAKKKKFDEYATAMSALLDQAMTYSDSLVELAKAGETGGEAAKKLVKTVNDFGSLAGLGAVSGPITTVFNELAKAATIAQAQESLIDATRAAQPGVDALATAVEKLYGEYKDGSGKNIIGPQLKLVTGLKQIQLNQLTTQAGPGLLGLYPKIKERRDGYYSLLQTRLPPADTTIGFCANPAGGTDSRCIAAQDVQSVAALNDISAQMEPVYREYWIKRAEAVKWRNERKMKAAAIVKAVKTWASEHAKVVASLESCGGFNVFQLDCAKANFPQLKATITEISAAF